MITFNVSSLLPIEHFKVALRDVSKDYPSTEFFLPSSILKVDIDNTHPIAYGMEETAAVLSYGSPVFALLDIDAMDPDEKNAFLSDLNVVARYPNGNPFMSGRLIGDHILHNKPALVEVECGKGRMILFGFRPQNRAQTHGTFKLFFNSLYYGPAAEGGK